MRCEIGREITTAIDARLDRSVARIESEVEGRGGVFTAAG